VLSAGKNVIGALVSQIVVGIVKLAMLDHQAPQMYRAQPTSPVLLSTQDKVAAQNLSSQALTDPSWCHMVTAFATRVANIGKPHQIGAQL